MNIVIEKNIPFIGGLLDPVASVSYLSPEEITAETMRDADALITRTRTRCDVSLLNGSRCRFIATATIGTDHIDLDYCRRRGITVANAPGCNAPAVAQYVLASVLTWLDSGRATFRSPEGMTIAVVGVGHVGSIVARWARGLSMRVLPVDPPRAAAEGPERFVTLSDAAREADIITFHTPLVGGGEYPTCHMAGSRFFDSLKRTPLIINSARGPIVDNNALLTAIDSGRVADAVIDCWEGEPAISFELLERAFIATPHIAGYSREGKIRATTMALDALTDFFSLPRVSPAETVDFAIPDTPAASEILTSYNPLSDTRMLREALSSPDSVAAVFESLRNHYPYRNEVR